MMKEKFTFLKLVIFLLLISSISLKAQNIIWERTFDTGGDDHAWDVCTDFSGNVIVTGHSCGKWLTIKYNPDGDTLWTRTFNIGSSAANGVATDSSGNVIVVGEIHTDSTGNDFCTVKYDPDGNILWIRTFGNNDNEIEEAHSVVVDSKGNIIVTGFTFFISSGYSYDYNTIKYDPDGNVIWVRTYDGGWNDFAEAVAVDDSDNVIVTGYSDSNINWDWCTVKYSPEGDTLWIRRYDVARDDRARGVSADRSGNVVVVGALGESHNRPASVVKYNSMGDTLWTKKFPMEEITSFIDVATDVDDNILLAGWYYIFFDGKLRGDFYTAKCDSDGDTLWTDIYDGGVLDNMYGITSDNDGNVLVTGSKGEGIPGYIRFDYLTIKYSSSANGIENELDFSTFTIKYTLHQNYPNPFNAATMIEYELPIRDYVCLKIYDVLGREVTTLIDEVQDSGYQSVKFDGSHLSSGIYFYQLITPTFTDTKKLLIIK